MPEYVRICVCSYLSKHFKDGIGGVKTIAFVTVNIAACLDMTVLSGRKLRNMTIPTGHSQPRRNTNCLSDKIPRHALGPQAKLERPYCYEEEANRAQSKRIILASRTYL